MEELKAKNADKYIWVGDNEMPYDFLNETREFLCMIYQWDLQRYEREWD